jgi:hypothetical protein
MVNVHGHMVNSVVEVTVEQPLRVHRPALVGELRGMSACWSKALKRVGLGARVRQVAALIVGLGVRRCPSSDRRQTGNVHVRRGQLRGGLGCDRGGLGCVQGGSTRIFVQDERGKPVEEARARPRKAHVQLLADVRAPRVLHLLRRRRLLAPLLQRLRPHHVAHRLPCHQWRARLPFDPPGLPRWVVALPPHLEPRPRLAA